MSPPPFTHISGSPRVPGGAAAGDWLPGSALRRLKPSGDTSCRTPVQPRWEGVQKEPQGEDAQRTWSSPTHARSPGKTSVRILPAIHNQVLYHDIES